jgi:hypothetical protein
MSRAWILDALGPMDLTNRPMIPRIYVSLVIALVTPFAARSAQDAPMFRGDLAHTAVYKSAAPRTLDVVKWKFSTGAYMISSPAIVGDLVYVGSTDGRLYAIDRESVRSAGRSRPVRASSRRRRWPTASSTSAAAMATSTP